MGTVYEVQSSFVRPTTDIYQQTTGREMNPEHLVLLRAAWIFSRTIDPYPATGT
ncbi:unnamed protein product [Periconia digitata]|uniref:Uncharacterized protein n=1 Tax=Periconia digitata TaxID=1303443 RepID=A0A9W4U5E2_9PLEO|nr:unnamed protein product [Periconia digitata]